MKTDWLAKFLLMVIAVSLSVIAFRPFVTPARVEAQSGDAHPFYIEPGVTMLRAPDGSRQLFGRVVVDMRNGNVWGFPTFTQDLYPTPGANTTPPTSHPFLLGKFAFGDLDK